MALFKGLSINRKSFLPMFFLILNSVTWFYMIVYITGLTAPELIPFASSLRWLFYSAVIVSALIGPTIAERVNKIRFLIFWVFFGVISSLLLIGAPTFSKSGVAMLMVFLGFAFGIGFPSALALIPALTRVEERGRVSGVIFCITYAISPLFLFTVVQLDIFFTSLMLVAWRSLSLGVFLLHIRADETAQLRPVSYLSVLRRGKFFLYFFPWLALCLINYFGYQVLGQSFSKSMMALMGIVEFTVGSLFCLISGWLMDLKGRKQVIIGGMVMLGLGYALLSLFPFIPPVQAFYMIVDSIAFGIFTVAFVSVVWGDMSNGERGDKFYALGNIPVTMAIMLSLFISPWLTTLSLSGTFSLASFFIFLAIIPLFFAPELLPEKMIKEREVRKYVEEAKKVARR